MCAVRQLRDDDCPARHGFGLYLDSAAAHQGRLQGEQICRIAVAAFLGGQTAKADRLLRVRAGT